MSGPDQSPGQGRGTALGHLRILLVLPLYGGSLPIGRYCAKALKSLGHVVEVFEAPEFNRAYEALQSLRVATDRQEYLENSFLNVVSQAVLAKVEAFAPDLVLCMAQAPMSRQALTRLRKDKVATAMWFVEDYRLFTYWRAYAPLYDVFAVIQGEDFLSRLFEQGVDNCLYLPLAADPDFHKPLELTSVQRREYGADVSFLGAGYPNRRRAFRQLVGAGHSFKIWGTQWEREDALTAYVQRGGARIEPEEVVCIFNATKINLNLHSSVQDTELVPGGDFVNPRTFELASCGAFQLVDRRSLMADLFEDDELVTFGSVEELRELIGRYLSDETERAAVAERARARVLAGHTYGARMAELLEFCARRLPDWPRSRQSADWPEDFPPELRDKVEALLTRLELPADTGFDDLVWALRQQQGALDELETSILFLDEWRKQYGVK